MSDKQSVSESYDSASTSGSGSSLNPGKLHTFVPFICFACVIMLFWPWIFFGITWYFGGIQMYHIAAKIILDHRQDATYFVTALCNAINYFVTFLFGAAVVNLGQQWFSHRDMNISHIMFFSALKSGAPSISLLLQGNIGLFVIIIGNFVVFLLVAPGINALLTPVPFNRKVFLAGRELDFASTDTVCIDWFNRNTISHTCDWMTYNGVPYTDCLGENQMVDVLESGRGSILSLISNNNISLTFSQLGGVHFLGTMRGVLPTGPGGVPAFDILPSSAFSDVTTLPGLSYSYTLDLQGVSSNVSCTYDTGSPVVYSALSSGLWGYSGTCPPGQDILAGAAYVVPISNNSLGFWACQTSLSGDSFTVYLRGTKNYQAGIGNITCDISPFQPAVFSLEYNETTGIFNFTAQKPIYTSPNTTTELFRRAVMGLGSSICEAQNVAGNLVAESVTTFGVKFFRVQPYVHDDTYLRLYEAMIRGILDYQATYIRLIYSTKISGLNSVPSSCMRPVIGVTNIGMFGWFVTRKTAAYLIPMTLLNLTTLSLLFAATQITDGYGLRHPARIDPTDPAGLFQLLHKRRYAILPDGSNAYQRR